MTDRLIRGLLPEQNVRFALCQAAGLCTEGVRRHQSDHLAGWLLSEALTCATLLSIDLKGREKMTLRWLYTGPVGEILADTTESAAVRGFTRHLKLIGLAGTLDEAVGKEGQVAATTSLPNRVLHTGITNAVFQDVSLDMAHLLSLSFQVETAMAVGLIMPPEEPVELRSAVGVLLQPLPGADLEVFDVVRRKVEQPAFRSWLEVAPRPLEAVLERLADGSPHQVLDEREPRFVCTCSRAKVESVLRMLDPAEIQEMLEQDGQVDVSCHFCGSAYTFGAAELHTLLRQSESGHA